MKKVILIVFVALCCVQNSVLAMDRTEREQGSPSTRVFNARVAEQEDSLETYKKTVKKLERLVNEIDSPSDIHRIRITAKRALSQQPKNLKGNFRVPLDLYARFGTGTSLKSFLHMSNIVMDLVRRHESERKIHSAILAALIMAPGDIKERDFKVLRPAFYKK